MSHPVVHWEITAKDPDKIKGFYGQLFDWNIATDEKLNYALVSSGGIDGGIAAAQCESAQRVKFYVHVEDLAAYQKKAEELGGKAVGEPIEIPGVVTFAMVSDPEGNLVGLLK